MKAEPTTKELIEMLYVRHPEIFHRPKREWVELTVREIEWCFADANDYHIATARNIEAKLKEKNT